MSRLVIVVPAYNAEKYLNDLINSLKKQSLQPEGIVFVDNNSTDKSLKTIFNFQFSIFHPTGDHPQGGNQFPISNFKIISNKINLGFARACNQGVEEALKMGAEYIFVLNQDTILKPDCLEELNKAAETDSNIFAVQPLILCQEDRNKKFGWAFSGTPSQRRGLCYSDAKIQSTGDKIHFLGFGYLGDYKKLISDKPLAISEIAYASGAAMFIRSEILKKVGFFDQDYFLYHEDMDLSLRARLLGYKLVLAPKAKLYHYYPTSISKNKWYWSERNRQLTLLKFYKLPTLILIFPFWLIMELGILAYSFLTGWGYLKIKSYFSVLKQLPKTLKKRKKIQQSRKISDRQFIKYLESEFDFRGFVHPILKYLVNPIFGFSWRILKNFIFW